MAKLIKIVPFSSLTAELQKRIIAEISALLPDSKVELIGSSAVPLDGREEIDIMVISNNVSRDSEILKGEGYDHRGMENEISYFKKLVYGYDITPQIIPQGHKMITIHHDILHRLRTDERLRNAYASFKKSLEGLTKEEYRTKKKAWIREHLLS